MGIPSIARKDIHVMELAYLVGDHEEVHLGSLKWKEVWVKVACKDPRKINGTSNVYINKQDKGQEDDELTKAMLNLLMWELIRGKKMMSLLIR